MNSITADDGTDVFLKARPRLFTADYRMLGSVSDAGIHPKGDLYGDFQRPDQVGLCHPEPGHNPASIRGSEQASMPTM